MNHSLPLNAFQSVRPRGPDLDIPAAKPKSKASQSRETSAFGTLKAMDSNGRRTVDIAPRAKSGITIESREQSAASVAKTRRISKGA